MKNDYIQWHFISDFTVAWVLLDVVDFKFKTRKQDFQLRI
jgi:hypothetical protein